MIGISKWLLSVAWFFLCFLGWPNAFIYVILFACYATKFKQRLLCDTRISIIYNNRNKVTYGRCVGVFVCDMYLCMCVWNGMALTRIKLLESDWNAFESHWRFIEQTLYFHLSEPFLSRNCNIDYLRLRFLLLCLGIQLHWDINWLLKVTFPIIVQPIFLITTLLTYSMTLIMCDDCMCK